MKPIRRGSSPIKVPFQLRSTSKAMAAWANEVRTGMIQLRDRIPQGRAGRGGGGGGGGSQPLKLGVRTKADSLPGSPVFEAFVTPGFVNNVMPKIGGVLLDATPSPGITIVEGDNWLHLKGTYEPSVFELGAGYAAVGSAGSVSDLSFVLTNTQNPSPAEEYPKITGGAASDGNFDILWGKIVKDGDSVTIEIPSGGGDAAVVFMPPSLYVAFRNTNTSAPAAP